MIRLSCAVPGCTHTLGDRKGQPPNVEGQEWVCGDHWRLVPKWMRAIKARTFRRARRAYTQANINSALRVWARCKREAIERGMGLK